MSLDQCFISDLQEGNQGKKENIDSKSNFREEFYRETDRKGSAVQQSFPAMGTLAVRGSTPLPGVAVKQVNLATVTEEMIFKCYQIH